MHKGIFLLKIIIIISAILLIIIAGIFILLNYSPKTAEKNINDINSAGSIIKNDNLSSATIEIMPPIDRWSERVTKKPFGIYVSPKNSPVSPEHFTGYHTGVDFEIFPDEQDKAVSIKAICSGELLLKESASGYGGVIVQGCKLNGQDITVIYGHLKLSSVTTAVGQQLSAGDNIGILGKGYSQETDGERKHLHLGIHQGKTINIKGYVQNSEELAAWIDITEYLK